ncbi:MAG: hemolysin family protein, partial [Abditibacteriales bacterium]|nr:hemolysin family protein [Abditibacteriales bacterium]MDW8367332.1 hemolysin family protein [Abditibacteriales bacterium]
ALFSLAEAVLFVAPPPGGRQRSKRTLVALVMGLYGPLLLGAALITHIVYRYEPLNALAAAGVGVVAVAVILLFACVLPHAFAAQHAERGARSARWLLRLLHPADRTVPAAEAEDVSADDLKSLVELGEAAGVLEAEETAMIENIFDLGNTTAREIMVPRPDIVSLPADCDAETALWAFENSGFSRIPLYENSIDNIVGILYAKDLLEALCAGTAPVRPRDLAREPLFVPEMKKTDALFREMRATKTHLAVVIDEYGGTAGLVSIEDILEELVGEILDEHDIGEEKPIQMLADGSALVSARLGVEDLEEALHLSVPDGEFDTVGGFCLSQLGRVPSVGDTIETAEATFTIQQVRGRRVAKVKVTPKSDRGKGDQRAV